LTSDDYRKINAKFKADIKTMSDEQKI